jgi:hypothetical protein
VINGSTKEAITKAIKIGVMATIEKLYRIPIFLPQTLHFAGIAGPMINLRRIDIPSLPQCGHLNIFIFLCI